MVSLLEHVFDVSVLLGEISGNVLDPMNPNKDDLLNASQIGLSTV